MRYIIYGISFLTLFLSCKNVNLKTTTTNIEIRVFNFSTNSDRYELFNSEMIENEKNNEHYYVYKFDRHIDTLRYFDNNVYFNSQILKKIDTQELVDNGKPLTISKYYFENKKNYKGDRYIFICNEEGIVFIESLNSGTMIEFDVKKFSKIHKKIALKKVGFKDGPFELQYAKRNYKDFKYN
ncbi:hypothetical protein GJU43_12355 [Flavobacterium sp. LC2016-23]|uniref:hypothetical protein n=1 Tax=Flavobacterium sp. LC2016-23 TaxID=2666330 RepID=UPI0012B048D7|nr:hypothetical protein [Flavobacterium sp. LC2016-23]MRX40070.1 hypothetical protein [Flavobacterium sp. LC2016-23]